MKKVLKKIFVIERNVRKDTWVTTLQEGKTKFNHVKICLTCLLQGLMKK
jgi:hypothetical protein